MPMDVGAEFTIPNPFALLPSDFDRDVSSYRAALGFLGDLASGVEHDDALTNNGGSVPMLRSWQHNEKFRRVYAKCRSAGEAEREATRAREAAAAATEGEETTEPPGQRFIPLEDVPVQRGVFSRQPSAGSWGGP